MKIHLDTDIGGDIDDLCALVMMLKWKDIEIIGITTVADDNGKRAGYAKYALNVADRQDTQVKAGADVSGGFYRYKPGFPKEEDYWPEPIDPAPNSSDEALEFLKSSIEQNAVIVCIGQYTNLYLLDQKYPGILKEANIFFMGGSIFSPRDGYPQWGNDRDYNMQLDTISAQYVIENSTPTLVTMAVTLETYLRRAYIEDIRSSGAIGKLLVIKSINLDCSNSII